MQEQQPTCQTILEALAEATIFASTQTEFAAICEQIAQLEACLAGTGTEPDAEAAEILARCREQAVLGRDADSDLVSLEAVAMLLQEDMQQLQDHLANAPSRGAEPEPPKPQSPERQFELPEWVDETVFRDFISNHTDSIVDVEREIMEIEEGNGTALADLKRRVHTLKGEAGLIGLQPLEHLCHVVEELLETPAHATRAINQLLAFKDWVADALLAYSSYQLPATSTDALVQEIEAVTSPPAPVEPEAAPEPDPPPPAEPTESPATPAPAASGPHGWDDDTMELIQEFLAEGEDGLTQVDDIFLQAEDGNANDEHVNAAFRVFHTIKGVAGFLELEETQSLSHAAESLLNKIREGRAQLAGQNLDLLFAAASHLRNSLAAVRTALGNGLLPRPVDGIPALINDLGAATDSEGAPSPAPASTPTPVAEPAPAPAGQKPAAVEQTPAPPPVAKVAEPTESKTKATHLKEVVKVDLERVDNLVDLIGELVIVDSMITNSLEQMDAVATNALRNHVAQMSKITRDLQGIATSMRMVPVRAVFQKMARMVRDLSQKSGKPVRAVLEGETTELDRSMVEQISDPLVHMIRNSIDHGIEDAETRRQLGKPQRGTIHLRAFHEGGRIVIQVADDGKGLDREAILAKAKAKNLVKDGQALTDQEIYQLIFAPGFSTAKKVTEISGRGVGMDVVCRNVESMRGKITLDSKQGAGTTFNMQLPLTMAIIEGTLIRCGNERYVLPTLSMYESLRPTEDMVVSVAGKGEVVNLRNETIPLYRLGRLLRLDEAGQDVAAALIVILESHGAKIGLVVDEVIDQQQVVIKGMGVTLAGTRYISGAAIMSDGRVGLILNPDEIPALAERYAQRAEQ
jgi:two-component system chemotaxis sensor kinase CheA